jgi:2'-5' RNA ligase
MRLFLAVHPPPRFVAELTTRLDPWRADLALAWTRPESWHLTLQFLGVWPVLQATALQAALASLEPVEFLVKPGAVGAFPHWSRPRVLILHMAGDGKLAGLAAAVREIVHGVWPDGPQDSRPFRGHLTLARMREPLAKKGQKTLLDMDLRPFDPFPVDRFRLMASELHPQGAQHREVAFYPLRKKGE